MVKSSKKTPAKRTLKKAPISKSKSSVKSAVLKLDSISYSEAPMNASEWSVKNATFVHTNLLVGRNSSGKTRILNIIAGLARTLTGDAPNLFTEGQYSVQLSTADKKTTYIYNLNVRKSVVEGEELIRNGQKLLIRRKKGIGKIWAEKIGTGTFIDFETPPNQLAAKNRRDAIQHPYLSDIFDWAQGVRHYSFGTSLGKDRYMMPFPLNAPELASEVKDASEVTKLYAQGYTEFKEEFDKRILEQMAMVGYNCTDVGAEPLQNLMLNGVNVLGLFVKEQDLAGKTDQLHMSQGMFRALSMIIHLTYTAFKNSPRTILIDDIGEGLDFARSRAFVALLTHHAETSDQQMIMTTNDRFIMNDVPLEYWGIVSRKKSEVKLINIRNSAKIFDDFTNVGLNNFDFFATDFFEHGFKDIKSK